MLRYLLLSASSVLLLLGCQTSNPYQAESLQQPPAPAAAATHFDASAYPIAIDKKTYTYWCWHDQPLNPIPSSALQTLERQVLTEQLEQYAFRPASTSAPCELKIKLSSQHSQRIRHDYNDSPSAQYGYGFGRGYPYNERYRYSGIGVDFPITPRSYTEHYQQLTLTFTDAKTDQIIWQTQSQISSNQHAETSEKALREAMNRMLKDYN